MADKNYVGVFNCRDDSAILGTRWTRWLASFELFADSRGLIMTPGDYTNRQQRRAQLLHFAGPDVQDIFLTLPNTGTVRDYDAVVTALSFVSKVNPALKPCHTRAASSRRPRGVQEKFRTPWCAQWGLLQRRGLSVASPLDAVRTPRSPCHGAHFEHAQSARRGSAL